MNLLFISNPILPVDLRYDCINLYLFLFLLQAAKMKQILVSQTVKVQEGVTVKVNARRVTVVGPRGKLTRDFKHLALDMQVTIFFLVKWYAGF